jgi:thiamine-monophosphate kinase
VARRAEAAIAGSEGSVADLGEWGIIAALAGRMPAGPLTTVGIGDDAAVVTTPSGSVVAAVDMLLEGRHFLLDRTSAYDIGVKAAARSLADIAAMGAVNTALLVALAAPGRLPASWATGLADGLAAEATRAGAGVVGGDTASADLVTLSVTALGDLEGRAPVLRSGARPGDVLAVAGPLGRSAAGLALLDAGLGSFSDTRNSPSAGPSDAHLDLVSAHLRPAPPYDAGPEAALLGATAMIDVSDGLVADIGHVADASGVQVEVRASALDAGSLVTAATSVLAAAAPANTGSANTGSANTESANTESANTESANTESANTMPGDTGPAAALALTWVLTGGEDHSLVATFPPSVTLPARWRIIGEVRPGEGVTVDGVPHQGAGGWRHFA